MVSLAVKETETTGGLVMDVVMNVMGSMNTEVRDKVADFVVHPAARATLGLERPGPDRLKKVENRTTMSARMRRRRFIVNAPLVHDVPLNSMLLVMA